MITPYRAFFIIFALASFYAYTPFVHAKSMNVSSMYEITKHQRYVSGHKWRYVLVNESATKQDVQKIYEELRDKYPNDYFELFNDKDTLVAMYMHSRKKAKFPDTKGHLGMINQMGYDDEWRFTTMSGYQLLEE